MSFTCKDCSTAISGSNCAHELSRQEGWRNVPGCYAACVCGYPVRAKELRSHKFTLIDNNKQASENAYIYCENSRGEGHVYRGTYSTCVRGNGYTAQQMDDGANFTFTRNNAH